VAGWPTWLSGEVEWRRRVELSVSVLQGTAMRKGGGGGRSPWGMTHEAMRKETRLRNEIWGRMVRL
jgi:hypothetical protein